MNGTLPAHWPTGAAPNMRQIWQFMDVILHLGAHRTATTTFQRYTREQTDNLRGQGVAFWGPKHCRTSVFPGLFRKTAARKGRNVARRATGRIRMFAEQEAQSGAQSLLISDENLLGTPADNLRRASLYPAAGERIARVHEALGADLRRIVLCIRSQDLWWASCCALTVSRGHPVPEPARLEAISRGKRTWRDVITDIACAAPEVELQVLAFEHHAGRPDQVLRTALETEVKPDSQQHWLNASMDLQALRRDLAAQGRDPALIPQETGRWQPFDDAQASRLREHYADDLHWLIAGADGLATLTEEMPSTRAGSSPPAKEEEKGLTHDAYQGKLA